MIEVLWQDARYAMRGMARNKGFTATAVLLLALALGANTAMFTVVKRVLLDPLPYPESDRLVRLWSLQKQHGVPFSITALDYLDWAAQTRTFDRLAAYGGRGMTITGEGEPELFTGVGVSANLFQTLGVRPILGRDFRAGENERGPDRVLILGHSFWRRKFGGDPSAVGRVIRLNGESYQVIGVMPQGFAFPDSSYDAWTPLAFKGGDPDWINRSAHYLRVIGRLKPGQSLASANAEMTAIAAQLERAYPGTNLDIGVHLRSLKDTLVGDSKTLVLLLYGAVTLLLLVACSNLAGLLIARSAARRFEFATRSALGASRLRLASQMAVESLLLSAAGGAAGLGLARLLLAILKTRAPEDLPRAAEIALDPAVIGFSMAFALVAGLLFGLAPAAGLSRLVEAARGSAASGLRQRTRSALAVAQIALSVILLVGAGLFLRSFYNLSRVDKGFDSEGVVTMNFVLGVNEYKSSEKMIAFGRQLGERLAAIPGMIVAGFATSLPLSGQGWGNPVTAADYPIPPGGNPVIARIRGVSPGYFRALGSTMRIGRLLSEKDDARSPLVVIVDETFVRTVFRAAESPIGKRIRIGSPASTDPWRTIVGVVGESRQITLEGPLEPHVFLPYSQLGERASMAGRGLYLVGRSTAPLAAAGMMKAQIASLDPNLPVREVELLSARVDRALAPQRFRAVLMAGFAGLALLLAAVGLYGVIAFAVTQRTQEIGVRVALGARSSQIARMVVGDAARLGAVGVILGIGGALAATSLMEKMLFGVSRRDALTLAAVALILTFVTLLASYLPARRAASIDPMRALRME